MATTLSRKCTLHLGLLPILASCLLGAQACRAGLGDPAASVEHDRATLRGTALTVTSTAHYERHEITTERGGRVREYVSQTGTVFAVAWSGPVAPDLKAVLGSNYDAYVAAATNHRGSHHVFSMAGDNLVLTITRPPRGFRGMAHLPALLPAGTDPRSLR